MSNKTKKDNLQTPQMTQQFQINLFNQNCLHINNKNVIKKIKYDAKYHSCFGNNTFEINENNNHNIHHITWKIKLIKQHKIKP